MSKTKQNIPDYAASLQSRWVEALTRQSVQQPETHLECHYQGYGTLQLGCGFEAPFLKLGGKEYAHGLGTHADSEILLRCAGEFTRIEATVGVDENQYTLTPAGERARIVFSIEVAGNEIW